MSAEKMVEMALSQVGYLEKKSNDYLDDFTANAGYNNYNKYARDIWPSLQAQPWCDIFVSWVAIQVGEGSAVGKYAYVPSHVQFFKNKGAYFARGAKTPIPGDIIFFQQGGDPCHVGIVEYVNGNYVHTIEGNASGGSGLTPNGGGVVRKTYHINQSYILGYGRPAYSGVSSSSSSASTSSDSKKKEMFVSVKAYKNGSTDEPVYADTKLSIKIGSLDPYETCDCLGVVDGRPLVYYKVDGASYYKTGFVEYGGGVL